MLAALGILLLVMPAVARPNEEDPALATDVWQRSALDLNRDRVDDALDHATGELRILVDFARAPTAHERSELARIGARIVREITIVPTLVVDAPATTLTEISHSEGVLFIEEDSPLRASLDESRPLVRADEARRAWGVTGAGVTIAILDTGVDATHPDYPGTKLLFSYDSTLPKALPRTLLGIPIPAQSPITDPHGTHVAGIAAGTGVQSGGQYRGIAPAARIVSVKVFSATGAASSDTVLAGIDWVVAHKDEFGIRILSISLGGRGTDGTDALSRGVDAAADVGLLTVAAAGNGGPDASTVGIPAVAARALAVGSVDKSLHLAESSGRGPTVDGRRKPEIVAPGVSITSSSTAAASAGTFYATMSGTSQAAPHVSGAAALVLEANSTLRPAMVKWILMGSSRAIGPNPHAWDSGYGFGFLDVESAIRAARDPRVLGTPTFVETARGIPFDEGDAPVLASAVPPEEARVTDTLSLALTLVALGILATARTRHR